MGISAMGCHSMSTPAAKRVALVKRRRRRIISSFLRCCVKWSRRSSSLSFSFLSPYWQYIYDYDVYRCASYIVVSPALCTHNSTNVLHNGESVQVCTIQRYYTGQYVTKKKKKTIHHRGWRRRLKRPPLTEILFFFSTRLCCCCIYGHVAYLIQLLPIFRELGETRNLKPK